MGAVNQAAPHGGQPMKYDDISVNNGEPVNSQKFKYDNGKIKPALVPTQMIRDVAEVREYGVKKYKDPDNWKNVELERYINAFYRHWLAFIDDPESIDEESGIKHYKHAACNMAFICEMLKES